MLAACPGFINGTFTVDGKVDYFDNHPHKLMLCLYNDEARAVAREALLGSRGCTRAPPATLRDCTARLAAPPRPMAIAYRHRLPPSATAISAA